MKARAALSVAVAAIGLSPVASAHTRASMEHAETASALRCLLDHDRKACGYSFVGSASGPATHWLWWTAGKDFELGALVSLEYAGTQSTNAYTTVFLKGETADVYDVKFRNQEKTFYIARPGPDGKVHYILVRNGAPNDERADLWARNPLGLF
jgi:hypothetical protein